MFSELVLQKRRPDDAVVVFAGNRTLVFKHKRIHAFCNDGNGLAYFLLREIHERNNVKIAVPDVPCDIVHHELVVFIENGIKAGQKFRKHLGRHHNIVNKRRRLHPLHLVTQQVETFAADKPVLFHLDIRADNFDIAGPEFPKSLRKSVCLPLEHGRVFAVKRNLEHEFRQAVAENRKCFRNTVPCD